jgi:hypothetical protein
MRRSAMIARIWRGAVRNSDSDAYVEGMPDDLEVPIEPLPFTYMSTGRETRFKNGLDPDGDVCHSADGD